MTKALAGLVSNWDNAAIVSCRVCICCSVLWPPANGNGVKDLSQYETVCAEEIIRKAECAQRILSEHLMPSKKNILAPHHLQALVRILELYFDSQYSEGNIFTSLSTSKEILRSRISTIGIMTPTILCLTSAQAEVYRVDDPCLSQTAALVELFHDMIGLYIDLDALLRKDDSSASLNLVTVLMREKLCEEQDFRFMAKRINTICRSYELSLDLHSLAHEQFYHHILTTYFNFYDFHLIGISGSSNSRYGWRMMSSERN